MINLSTILSSFNEKGTLLQWLKNVEKSLNNASLSSTEILSVGANQIQIKFVFADGSSVTSPTLTLPEGPEGPEGPAGPTGNGIEKIELTKTVGNVDTYTIYYTNGNTFEYNVTNATDGGGTTLDVAHLLALMQGDNHINIDESEDGSKVVVSLDQTFINGLATSQDITDLEAAVSGKQEQLTEAQLNAVNSGINATKVSTYDAYSTNKQNKLTAGTGISIDNDVISATGGGGGANLYKHTIQFDTSTGTATLVLISTRNTSYTNISQINNAMYCCYNDNGVSTYVVQNFHGSFLYYDASTNYVYWYGTLIGNTVEIQKDSVELSGVISMDTVQAL